MALTNEDEDKEFSFSDFFERWNTANRLKDPREVLKAMFTDETKEEHKEE